jgi:hypothetical protein
MTLELKIDRNYLRYLFDKIRYENNKFYVSFEYDIVKIVFYNLNKTLMHSIKINYEYYLSFLNKDTDPILIKLNTNDFFKETNDKDKYNEKFIILHLVNNNIIIRSSD